MHAANCVIDRRITRGSGILNINTTLKTLLKSFKTKILREKLAESGLAELAGVVIA